MLAYSDTIHFLVCQGNGGTDRVDGLIMFASLKLVQKEIQEYLSEGLKGDQCVVHYTSDPTVSKHMIKRIRLMGAMNS